MCHWDLKVPKQTVVSLQIVSKSIRYLGAIAARV